VVKAVGLPGSENTSAKGRRPSVREVAELAALGWVLVALADCGSQEAVSPLFGEPARASEDHWNVRVAYGKPTKHVCQPGAATGLTPEEIGVFTLDHDRRPADLSQTLHLKSQAAFGQRVGQVLERLTLDYSNHGLVHNSGIVTCRKRSTLDRYRPTGE